MPKSSKIMGSPNDLEAAFYDAIARGDIEALMALWSDDDDIVCIHPGSSRLIGHAEIRASWEAVFENGGVRMSATQLHASHNLMSAVHSVFEEVRHPGGEQPDLHIIATNVYMKTPRGWRIALHHASVAQGPAPRQAPAGAILH